MNHRVGGLEVGVVGFYDLTNVNHRVGGLEGPDRDHPDFVNVNHRAGGFEKSSSATRVLNGKYSDKVVFKKSNSAQ